MTRLRGSIVVGSTALACAGPLMDARAQSRWSLRAEAGQSALHESTRRGSAAALRLTRDIGPGFLRAVGGVALAGADGGFGTLDVALELVPLPRSILTPVVALGIGGIAESEWRGGFGQVTGALEWRLSPRVRLRGAVQSGRHGENQLGPNLTTVGVAVRLGRPPER